MLPEDLTTTLECGYFYFPGEMRESRPRDVEILSQVSEPAFTPGLFNSSVCGLSNHTGVENQPLHTTAYL